MTPVCPDCEALGICQANGAKDQYKYLIDKNTPRDKLYGLVRFFLEASERVEHGCLNKDVVHIVTQAMLYIEKHGLRRYYTDE